jgi:cysteine synthase A
VCELKKLDDIICVDDGDAIIMAQKLSSELGLGLGISSGANFLGAIIAQEKLGYDANVVTIFCDSNKKYLSTDLMKKEAVLDGFLSSEIELIDFQVHERAFSENELATAMF